jgi:hypothetical protein
VPDQPGQDQNASMIVSGTTHRMSHSVPGLTSAVVPP